MKQIVCDSCGTVLRMGVMQKYFHTIVWGKEYDLCQSCAMSARKVIEEGQDYVR